MKTADSLKVIIQKTWRMVYWSRAQLSTIKTTWLHKYFYKEDEADEYAAKIVSRFNRRYCGGGR